MVIVTYFSKEARDDNRGTIAMVLGLTIGIATPTTILHWIAYMIPENYFVWACAGTIILGGALGSLVTQVIVRYKKKNRTDIETNQRSVTARGAE